MRKLVPNARLASSPLIFLLLLAVPKHGLQAAPQNPSSTGYAGRKLSVLDERIAAARAARDSGDSNAATLANNQLIALALRDVARIRTLQADYPKAIELYTQSLTLEESPETRLDLATAEIQAGKPADAVIQAEKAHNAAPTLARGDRVLASALVQNGEYAKALAPFSRIVDADPKVENLYPLAVCLLQTHKAEDKQQAMAVFARMQKVAGDSGSLHVLFGRAYRDAGDMTAAIAEFHQAVALDPKTPHAHYFLGLAMLFQKDWKPTPEAEAELRKEAELYPNDYLANYMLGFLISGARRYDESNQYLERARTIDPLSPEPVLYLGLNAYSQDDRKKAEEMLLKAIQLTGNDESRSNFQIRRAYVDLGRILSTSNREEEAAIYIGKARDLQNKTMKDSQQKVATMALAEGASSSAAIVALGLPGSASPTDPSSNPVADSLQASAFGKLSAEQQKAVQDQEALLRSVLGLAFNDLGTSEAVRGEYLSALVNYEHAETWDKSQPGLARNLGVSAFRAEVYSEAVCGLSAALLESPGSAATRAQLGMAYFLTNKFADAANTFAPLGTQGMQDPQTGYAWAASLVRTGDLKQATEVLSTFESASRPAETQLLVGKLWTEIGDFPRAIATFQRSLDADPSLPKAHFLEGLAYIRWTHWPEAAREFKSELQLMPGDPDATYHLGYVDLQLSKTDDAVELFKQVVAAHSDYVNAQYQLGKVFLDRGQASEAVAHLERAAQIDPGAGYLHYQLQAAYRQQNRVAEADHELEIYKQIKATSRQHAVPAHDQP